MTESRANSPSGWLPRAPRLRWLVVVHLVLAVVAGAGFMIRAEVRFLPLLWAACAVWLGQLMLLGFWAGMGTSKPVHRAFGTLFGVAYVGIWPIVGQVLSPYAQTPSIGGVLFDLGSKGMMVVLVAGVFLLFRRTGTELRHVADAADAGPPGRFQYSILHVLLIISVAAVVLGLVQSARGPGQTTPHAWRIVGRQALLFVSMLVNFFCAAWAVLGPGRTRLGVSLVLLVAALLGMALSLGANMDRGPRWLLVSFILIFLLATVIVIASLLVVRSCGYRLIRKATAP